MVENEDIKGCFVLKTNNRKWIFAQLTVVSYKNRKFPSKARKFTFN